MEISHGELYDAPLNLAHHQARRAEVHQACGRYDDAITCHHRAAEYLLQAIEMTSSTSALESLQLQKDYHKRQAEIISSRKSKPAELPTDQHSSSTNGGRVTDGKSEDSQTDNTERVYQTIEQCDTLLCFLDNRPSVKSPTSDGRAHNHLPLYQSGIKIQKDDKQIIEELRVHNESLQMHILSLLRECEQYRMEAERLRTENRRLNDDLNASRTRRQISEAKLQRSEQLDVGLGSLDLPPLEMPKFDFDLLSEGHRK